MRARRTGIVRAVLVVALAGGLGLTSAGIAEAATARVRGVFDDGRFVWKPKTRFIERVDSIRWRAVDGSHNVRSRGSNWTYSRDLPQGTSVTRRFKRTGRFRYYCTIHGSVSSGTCSGMCGRIVVS